MQLQEDEDAGSYENEEEWRGGNVPVPGELMCCPAQEETTCVTG